MLSNGAMFSRAGTAMVAMMSKEAGIPVVCCCETYKFSDRIMLDSIVGNELGVSHLNYEKVPQFIVRLAERYRVSLPSSLHRRYPPL